MGATLHPLPGRLQSKDRPMQAAEAEQAFHAYAEAARQAQATLDVRDGIAAGAAWGRFVRLFETQGKGRSA